MTLVVSDDSKVILYIQHPCNVDVTLVVSDDSEVTLYIQHPHNQFKLVIAVNPSTSYDAPATLLGEARESVPSIPTTCP